MTFAHIAQERLMKSVFLMKAPKDNQAMVNSANVGVGGLTVGGAAGGNPTTLEPAASNNTLIRASGNGTAALIMKAGAGSANKTHGPAGDEPVFKNNLGRSVRPENKSDLNQ